MRIGEYPDLLADLGLNYQPTVIKEVFSTDSRGEIDPERLLSGRPDCYKSINVSVIEKKKTIVIVDFAARMRKVSLIEFYIYLHQQGYTIYFWNDALIRIEKTADFDSLDEISMTQLPDATELISLLRLPKDEVKILDYFQINSIERMLTKNSVNYDQEFKLKHLLGTSDKEQDVIATYLSKYDHLTVTILYFPKSIILPSKIINIVEKNTSILLIDREFKENQFDFIPEFFRTLVNIKEIALFSALKYQTIIKLCKQLNSVKVIVGGIRLSPSTIEADGSLWASMVFTGIVEVDGMPTKKIINLNPQNFRAPLSICASALQELVNEHPALKCDEFYQKINGLTINCYVESVAELLTKKNNIKELTFDLEENADEKELDQLILEQQLKLASVIKLKFEKKFFNPILLKSLLVQMPWLRILELPFLNELDIREFLEQENLFLSVKQLTFSNDAVAEKIIAVFKKFPNLTALKLISEKENLNYEAIIKYLKNTSIIDFIFYNCLQKISLYWLMQEWPSLQSVEIYCQAEPFAKMPEVERVPSHPGPTSLVSFKIQCCECLSAEIKAIIEISPQLRSINLDCCTYDNKSSAPIFNDLDPSKAASVRLFKFSQTMSERQNPIQDFEFIRKFPNIIELRLLLSEADLNLNTEKNTSLVFTQLKKIVIDYYEVPSIEIKEKFSRIFLSNATQLTKLNAKNRSFTSKELILPKNIVVLYKLTKTDALIIASNIFPKLHTVTFYCDSIDSKIQIETLFAKNMSQSVSHIYGIVVDYGNFLSKGPQPLFSEPRAAECRATQIFDNPTNDSIKVNDYLLSVHTIDGDFKTSVLPIADIKPINSVILLEMPQFLDRVTQNKTSNYPLDLGQRAFDLSTNWQLVPIFRHRGEITLYAIESVNPLVDIEWGYSERLKAYFIRSKDNLQTGQIMLWYFYNNINQAVEIDASSLPQGSLELFESLINAIAKYFTVSNHAIGISSDIPASTRATFENLKNVFRANPGVALSLFYAFIRHFKPVSIKFSNKDYSIASQMAAMINSKAGSCGQRTDLFMMLMRLFELQHSVDGWAAKNDIHQWFECNMNGRLVVVDLGGSTANLVITNNCFLPLVSKKSLVSIKPDLVAEPYTKKRKLIHEGDDSQRSFPLWWQSILFDLQKEGAEEPNVLVTLPANSEAILFFVKELFEFYRGDTSAKIHVIYDLHAVTLENVKVTENGKIVRSSSELRDFLDHAKSGDVLVLYYDQYPAEWVGYNTVLDAKRILLNHDIPEGVIIVIAAKALIVKLFGPDFLSRIPVKKTLYLFDAKNKEISETHLFDERNTVAIQLYGDMAWQSILLKRIGYAHGRYFVIPGALITAIQENGVAEIVLLNPPAIKNFDYFFNELQMRREFVVNGIRYVLPPELRIVVQHVTPDFSTYQYKLRMCADLNEESASLVLNTTLLPRLFETAVINEQGEWIPQEGGLLAAFSNQKVTIAVNGALSALQWQKILDQLQLQNTEAIFTFSDISLIPAFLKSDKTIMSQSGTALKEQSIWRTFTVLTAEEPELTGAMLEKEFCSRTKIVRIMAAETTSYAELICGISRDPEYPNDIRLKLQYGNLLKWLREGYLVLLIGAVNHVLIDQLSSLGLKDPYLLINGQKESVPGQLMIIKPPVGAAQKLRISTLSSYWFLIGDVHHSEFIIFKELIESFVAETNLSLNWLQLRLMWESYLATQGAKNPLKNTLRLMLAADELLPIAKKHFSLLAKKEISIEKVLKKENIEDTKSYYYKYTLKILTTLKSEKTNRIFLLSHSGAGKSRFVWKKLIKYANYLGVKITLYNGMSSVERKAFAESKPSDQAYSILVMDEANLTANSDVLDHLLGFRGSPVHMSCDSTQYLLSDRHKMIGIGNHTSYANRSMHTIFSDIPIIMFKPLRAAILAKTIVRKLLKKIVKNENLIEAVSDILISIYQYVNTEISGDGKLTTRHLEMMAVSFLYSYETKDSNNHQQLAVESAYVVCRSVLNEEGREKLNTYIDHQHQEVAPIYDWFVAKMQESANQSKVALQQNNFVLCDNWVEAIFYLKQAIALYEFKKEKLQSNHGINSVLLQGDSSLGKSTIVGLILQEMAYQKVIPLSVDVAKKSYVVITPTEISSMTTIIAWAAKNGVVLLIDEINTMPLEQILNDRLTNATPNEPPFLMVGTLNPPSFAKRIGISEALEKRATNIIVPSYAEEELCLILAAKLNVNADHAGVMLMVSEFLEEIQEAKERDEIPETLRDLIRKVRERLHQNENDDFTLSFN